MMIDPKLLTPGIGFIEECVVEIVWDQSGPHRKEVAYWEDAREWSTEYMESIRPLTGPMAIWNLAPSGATALVSNMSGVNWIYADDYIHDNLVKRPFWATQTRALDEAQKRKE